MKHTKNIKKWKKNIKNIKTCYLNFNKNIKHVFTSMVYSTSTRPTYRAYYYWTRLIGAPGPTKLSATISGTGVSHSPAGTPLWNMKFKNLCLCYFRIHSSLCFKELDSQHSPVRVTFVVSINQSLSINRICNAHRGRRIESNLRRGQSPGGWGGYTLQVVREVRWVFSRCVKVSSVWLPDRGR